jgi:AcrR family transcriptional regulator
MTSRLLYPIGAPILIDQLYWPINEKIAGHVETVVSPATAKQVPPRSGPARNPLGRPPASDSADTRKRILEAARVCFGRDGYAKTTNRDIADLANITTGAIYHYFSSKPELYAATFHEASEIIFSAFEEAAASERTLVGKILAILDKAVELHAGDASLAAFSSSTQVEVRRHPEVERAIGAGASGGRGFWERLILEHKDEIAPDVDLEATVNALVAAVLGLAQFAGLADSPEVHRTMMASFKRLVEGTLFVKGRASADGRRRAQPKGRPAGR